MLTALNSPTGGPPPAIGTFGLFGTMGDTEKSAHLHAHVSDGINRQERVAIVGYNGDARRKTADDAGYVIMQAEYI